MLFLLIFYLFRWTFLTQAIEISSINNSIVVARNPSDVTRSKNGSCADCLCVALSSSYSAVNCFSNNSCQLFSTFPITYRIGTALGARLYFSGGIPSLSQCCMPNITELLQQLYAGIQTHANMSRPRDAIVDNNGYFVTVEVEGNHLDRFNSTTLTNIDETLVSTDTQWSVTYFDDLYYIATSGSTMPVIDGDNLTSVANISMSAYGARGFIFLNNGQTMILTFYDGNSLVFLNRTSSAPINYAFVFSQNTSFDGPHGMWRVNDSFFYVTSYETNALYSYSATIDYNYWTETLVLSVAVDMGIGMTRVTIDECGRFWLAFEKETILIYDQEANYLGNFTIQNSSIFDIKIMDNYLMYLTDSNGQIIRIEPEIQCEF